jgi:hypothetical protein
MGHWITLHDSKNQTYHVYVNDKGERHLGWSARRHAQKENAGPPPVTHPLPESPKRVFRHRRTREERERDEVIDAIRYADWERRKQIRDEIRHIGGIKAQHRGTQRYKASEYASIPNWAKNRNGMTMDQVAELIHQRYPGSGIESEDDLQEWLEEEGRKSFSRPSRYGMPLHAPAAISEAQRRAAEEFQPQFAGDVGF